MISAFGTMWMLGFTLNSVTMLALVLMVGIVIDDAIVVLENVFRFVEEKRMTPFEAAKAATADIGLAVMATTFSLVVIFLPVSFMSSVSGRFLYQFGVTAAVSVLVSLLVSFTLTPMMSARMIRAGATGGAHGHAEVASPPRLLCLARSWLRLLPAAVHALSLGGGGDLVRDHRGHLADLRLGQAGVTPTDVDESEFEATINGPEGISMPAMDEAVQAIADEIRAVPGVRHVLITAGGGFLGRISQGSIYVRTAPHDDRTFGLARLLARDAPGSPARGLPRQLQPARGHAAGAAPDAEVPRLPDPRAQYPRFQYRGRQLRHRLRPAWSRPRGAVALRGRAAHPGHRPRRHRRPRHHAPARPARAPRPHRPRAGGDLRVDTEQIATALRLMVGGDTEVSRFRDPGIDEDYYVQLRLSEKDRGDLGTISRLFVSRQGGDTGPGSLVRLDNLVQIASGFTASRIDRSDRQREVRLRAVVLPGFGQADRIAALRGAVAEMRLPAGYSTAISGRARELERTFTEFLWVFLLSVVFMYMILAAQFESLIHPLTILLSLPLSVPFALLSLWYTGNTLNLYSALGILVLFGVVKKNAILQIDHMNSLRARPEPRGRDHGGQPGSAAAHPHDHPGSGGRHAAALGGDGAGRRGAPGHRRGRGGWPDALPPADPPGHAGRLLHLRGSRPRARPGARVLPPWIRFSASAAGAGVPPSDPDR